MKAIDQLGSPSALGAVKEAIRDSENLLRRVRSWRSRSASRFLEEAVVATATRAKSDEDFLRTLRSGARDARRLARPAPGVGGIPGEGGGGGGAPGSKTGDIPVVLPGPGGGVGGDDGGTDDGGTVVAVIDCEEQPWLCVLLVIIIIVIIFA
jgi:hypothetical protein